MNTTVSVYCNIDVSIYRTIYVPIQVAQYRTVDIVRHGFIDIAQYRTVYVPSKVDIPSTVYVP